MIGNPWAAFRGLLPSRQPQIASVLAHNGDGTSTVQTLDGLSTYRARGQLVAVAAYALVRDGAVVEQATDLGTVVNLEV